MRSRCPGELSVFRPAHRDGDARCLADGIASDLVAGRTADALVRAGEIESALADAGAAESATAVALTDALAAALLGAPAGARAHSLALARSLGGAGPLRLVPPESFSYHGLHPRDVVARVGAPPLDCLRCAAVIGVRSAGSTLGAVLCAAVRMRGGSATRRTVRPVADPFADVTKLDSQDLRWIRRQLERGADFVVVDEEPALGSSVASVTDALVATGVPRERIFVVCTHAPHAWQRHVADARRRRDLHVAVVGPRRGSPRGFVSLPAGGWRRRFLRPEAPWPACWPWMERAKALSDDGSILIKFEGLGRYGAEAAARAQTVADAGFGPRARWLGGGLVAYEVHPTARSACASMLGPSDVDRAADYCAWRSLILRHEGPLDPRPLHAMLRINAAVTLGVDARVVPDVVRPVIADGHMMPHEWIVVAGRPLMKTDAVSHGDDPLFPGPTDAAWDVAGTIVEWRLPVGAIERLVDRYVRRSGDRGLRSRLPAWLLAYALHGLARTELAAAGCDDSIERARLEREADARRRWLRVAWRRGLLGRIGPALDAGA
jgi:hypothetical protein